ncbi:MAG: TolC family protein [Bacteroidia bacterium]
MAVALLPLFAFGQKELDLPTVVEMAKQNSPDAAAARTRFENSDWIYKSYKADLRPTIALNGTLPNFNSSISALDLDDGSQQFVSRSLATSLANVSLSQNIGLTGGSIFMSTGLQRIDVLGNNASTSYLSSPINIGFQQRVFGFNQFKWLKETEPMRYEEAQKAFYEEMENVAIRAVNLFFNYYDAKIARDLAKLNMANNDTLYKISKGRYQLGKIAEHELLQMELNVLNAQSALRQAKIDLSNAIAELQNYTGMDLNTNNVELVTPNMSDTFTVNQSDAVKMAMANRSDVVNMERQIVEAERNMAQAKANAGPNINLNASYGISGSNEVLVDAYGNTLPQQQFRTGISVPITTWGKGRAQVKIAESNKDLTEIQVQNQQLNFEQEVINQVNQFNFRKREYVIAAKSDTIGQKQYEIAYKRYMIGKIDITDLNLALQRKDQSRRTHISAMRNYWVDYYRLRQLTLYDFEQEQGLILEVEE